MGTCTFSHFRLFFHVWFRGGGLRDGEVEGRRRTFQGTPRHARPAPVVPRTCAPRAPRSTTPPRTHPRRPFWREFPPPAHPRDRIQPLLPRRTRHRRTCEPHCTPRPHVLSTSLPLSLPLNLSPSLSTSLPLSLRHSLCRPPSLSTSLNFNLASPLPRCLSQPLSVSRTVWCDRGCIESLSGHGTRKGCSPSSWGECRCGGSAALGQSRCRRLSLAPILSNSPWHSPQVSANLPTHAAHSVTSFSSTSIHAWHRLPSTLHHPGHSYPPSLPHPHRGSFFPILRGCGPPSPSPSPSGESRCPE